MSHFDPLMHLISKWLNYLVTETQIFGASISGLSLRVNLSVWATKLSQIDPISTMTQLLSQDHSELVFNVPYRM